MTGGQRVTRVRISFGLELGPRGTRSSRGGRELSCTFSGGRDKVLFLGGLCSDLSWIDLLVRLSSLHTLTESRACAATYSPGATTILFALSCLRCANGAKVWINGESCLALESPAGEAASWLRRWTAAALTRMHIQACSCMDSICTNTEERVQSMAELSANQIRCTLQSLVVIDMCVSLNRHELTWSYLNPCVLHEWPGVGYVSANRPPFCSRAM